MALWGECLLSFQTGLGGDACTFFARLSLKLNVSGHFNCATILSNIVFMVTLMAKEPNKMGYYQTIRVSNLHLLSQYASQLSHF